MIVEALRPLAVPIETLREDPRNERIHPERNLSQIKGSLARFGQRKAIVVRNDGTVIAGNGTLRAAIQLGWKEIAVVRVNDDDATASAYRIADNVSGLSSEWDEDGLAETMRELSGDDADLSLALATGFDEREIAWLNEHGNLDFPDFDKPQPTKGLTDPDGVPEQVETRCKPGDLWILGNHRLLCGDSTKAEDVARLMGDQKADLWLTDPPYGVSYQAKVEGQGRTKASEITNDDLPLEEMAKFWEAIATAAHGATTDKCSYYWFACQGGDQMMMMMSISRANWKVRHELIWVKDSLVLGRCDYHYKHEPILYGWKQEGTHEFFGDRTNTSTLECPRPRSNDLHPTMKPVELLERLINNSTRPDGRVLDSCLGSGSTLIACEKTGRRCFGMEIDPAYCDVAIARWEAFTGLKAMKSDSSH